MSSKGGFIDAGAGAKELVSNVQVCARIRPLNTHVKSKELGGRAFATIRKIFRQQRGVVVLP